jgi:dCMP deaminase
VYVCHAEMNAIMNKNSASLKGCRIYVALFPCNECAKLIIQSGITEVIFMSDKYHDAPPFVASRRLLNLAKVAYRQHVPARNEVVIRFDTLQK